MARRAALLIGVRRTGGGLPLLRAVGTGVEQMATWTQSQRHSGLRELVVLSDANSPEGKATDVDAMTSITAQDVSQAVKKLVESGPDQLLIYFAGHGANVRYNEYWLLSGAPDAASEAVNLDGSLKLARQCGIPHIVIIADACRTAAATLQAQAVEGTLVFPNRRPATRPGRVDVFYATVVGRPALEISSPHDAERLVAVYTKVLVEGLHGKAPLETTSVVGQPTDFVRPWPLQRYLETTVPSELDTLGAPLSADQTPDALITSPPESWISQLSPPPASPEDNTPATVNRARARAEHPTRGVTTARSMRTTVEAVISDALRQPVRMRGLSPAKPSAVRGHGERQSATAQFEDDPGCGFIVHGVEVTQALGAGVSLERSRPNMVRIASLESAASNVLLVFSNRCGALLPAVRDYVGVLTFDDGELANVVFQRSRPSRRRGASSEPASDLAVLRTMAAEASRQGMLRPVRLEDRTRLVARLRTEKWADPSLAIYLAYALAPFEQTKTLDEIRAAVYAQLEIELFDLALLTRQTSAEATRMPENVFPAVPLLSRGWALLEAYGTELPPSLRDLTRHVTNSAWTLLDEVGVAAVRSAIDSKEIS